MSKKRTFNPSKMVIKCRAYMPMSEPYTKVYGEPVQIDEAKGQKYIEFPAHPELKQYIRDLRKEWTLTEDFVEVDADEQKGEVKGK